MPPAPVFETDVEEDAPLDKWTYSRNTTVTTAQAVSPTHSLALTPLPDESAYMRKSLPAVTDQVVIHMRARWEDVPSIDSVYLWYWRTSSGRSPGMHFEMTGGVIEAQLQPGDSYQQAGPVLVADHWYDIWVRIDLSGTTHTLEWIVDGVEQATVTRPGDTPDSFDESGFRPSIDAGGPTVYLDDIAIYNDPGAYPTAAADLAPAGIVTGAPALASSALSQNHALVGDGIATGAPTTGTPALSQTHELTAEAVALGAPALASPALTQTHGLVAGSLTAVAPSLDKPAMGQVHTLTATGVVANAPALGAPAVGQAHALTTGDVMTGVPVLGAPSMAGEAALAADDLGAQPPQVGNPVLGQRHALTVTGTTAGSPVLGTPPLGSVAALTADNLVLDAPVVEATVLTQTHGLVGDDVATGPPELVAAAVEQTHVLTAAGPTGGTPLPGNPDLDQVHVLVAMPLTTTTPGPGRPPLMQTHELTAAGIVTGVPVPGRLRFRVPAVVCFSARMPGMVVSARAPRLTDVAARQPGTTFDVEEEICPRD